MRFIGYGAVVEMNHARFEPEGQIEHLLHIVRYYARCEPVVGGVGELERLLVVTNGAYHWV